MYLNEVLLYAYGTDYFKSFLPEIDYMNMQALANNGNAKSEKNCRFLKYFCIT